MNTNKLTSILFSALIVFTFSCKSKSVKVDILAANVDTTVKPSDDFFKYACGIWLKNNPIPESERMWGIGDLVQEETYTRLRKISEEASKLTNAPEGSTLQKIGDFYYSGMDTVTIENIGIRPLKPEFDLISSISNLDEVTKSVAMLQTYQVEALFNLGIYQDLKNSNKMALYINQGGLGLPDRDYYFNTDARTVNIRKEYVKHIAKMMFLLGEDTLTARHSSEAIMTIETELASKSRKIENLRDPNANYFKMSVDEITKITPSMNWHDLFKWAKIKNLDTVIVGQPEFLKGLESLLKSTDINNWKEYLKWQLISSYASVVNKDFVDENFHFKGSILNGVVKNRERWKRVLDNEEAEIGELLGQLYVDKYFSEKTKKRYENLVDNIMVAYQERIKKLDWMSDATKEKALSKLSKVVKKVGYPDKWKDFSSLGMNKNAYILNVLNANKWAFDYQIHKLGKPVDRLEWEMTPQTYNAYYNPSNNEIVLPAAIFSIPGLADEDADDAIIYAYAGASTIGHEITHGFDDMGKKYDESGNLVNWWTKTDEDKFNTRAIGMVNQFNSYIVLDSMHVNGKASLGENIADLGGIVLGYDAFQKTEQYKKGEKISGFTPDQRFFLGYALAWISHQRKESLARQIMTDVHSPAYLRVNGPLSNIPEFYKAFDVKPSDKMYRADSLRVKIW